MEQNHHGPQQFARGDHDSQRDRMVFFSSTHKGGRNSRTVEEVRSKPDGTILTDREGPQKSCGTNPASSDFGDDHSVLSNTVVERLFTDNVYDLQVLLVRQVQNFSHARF